MGRFPWIVVLCLVVGCGGDSARPPVSPPTSLFLAGDGRLTVVDVDAGNVEAHRLPELAPGDPPHRIVRRGSTLVLYGRDTYVVDTELSSPPRKLGDSWFFIPSAEPDRVWLAELHPASPETVRALASVREMTVDGRVTVAGVRPPGGRWPVAAAGDTLVFEDRRGGLELWDWSAREITRRITGASSGPGSGDLLAWCEDDDRTLHVTDVESGSDRTVALPTGFAAFDCASGAFSPDARSLAVPVGLAGGPKRSGRSRSSISRPVSRERSRDRLSTSATSSWRGRAAETASS